MEPMEMPNLKREDANIVCVIGAPGVGKGTQCTKLAKDLGVVHMCVGDLLRGDPEFESVMKKAGLVDYDKVWGLLKNVLDSHLKAGQKNILLDGFPRSPEQALFFQAEGYTVRKVLHFHCPRQIMLERVSKRGQTSGRVDDNEETFGWRYKSHTDRIANIADAFAGKIVDIDCSGELDDIYGDLKDKVKAIFQAEP